MRIGILFIFILMIVMLPHEEAAASNSLSYSGRLVNSNGSPVNGPVNLKFELAYTTPTGVGATLCQQNIPSVALSNGVFHVRLDPDCTPSTLTNVLAMAPSNESVVIRVTDTTAGKAYSFQALHSIPFANFSQMTKQITQMGATSGQVLAWDGSQWTPRDEAGTGNGSVTSVGTGAGLTGGPITVNGTISIATGGITNLMLAGGIDPGKLSGTRDASHYLKGDNTWGVFSNNVLATILTGYAPVVASDISATDSVMQAFAKLQGQTNALDSGKLGINGGTLFLGTINGVPDPTADDQIVNKLYVDDAVGGVNASQWTNSGTDIYFNSGKVGIGTSAPTEKLDVIGNIAVTGKVRYQSNSLNYIELRAPDNVLANLVFQLPGTAGSSGQALVNDGTGKLIWGSVATSSSSVGGDLGGTIDNAQINSGAVGSTEIADGSIVNADIATGAAIEQSKIQGLTTALDGKEDDITAGTTSQYWRGDKNWATLDTLVVPENVNLYFTTARARGAISGTTPLNYNATTGVLSLGTVPTALGGTGLTAPGTSGNLLKSDGTNWTSWTPDYLSAEADTLQTVTGRGATTTNAVTFSGVVNLPGTGIWNATGKVGIGTSTPRSKLEVVGGLQIGADAVVCDATKSGTLRYNASSIEFCNGTLWQAFGVSGAGITNINGSTVGTQTFAAPGTTGVAPAWSTNAATGVHTLNIPYASAAGVTAGLLSKTDYDSFSAKLGTTSSFSGDVSGTYNATSVDRIKGTAVAITTLTSQNFLKFNGTNWINSMLAATDIPSLDAGKITTGVLPVARGGTNTSSLAGNRIMVSSSTAIGEAAALTNGQLLIGSTGAAPVAANLTAGTGVTISNTAGGISISATGTGGTVTSVSGTAPISVATGTTTPVISISQSSGTANGFLSSADWTTFNNKQAADTDLAALASNTGTGVLVRTGDGTVANRTVLGTANRINVTNGNGVAGDPAIDISTSLLPSPLVGDAGKFLKASGANTSAWQALTSGEITTALGFTPVNKAGDSIPSGVFDFNTSSVVRVLNPIGVTDVANKQYVDAQVSGASNQWAQSSGNVYRTSGNVGIGTTTPGYLLDVEGNSTNLGRLTTIGDNLGYLDIVNSNTGNSAGSILRLITKDVSNATTIAVDIVKYRTGGFIINNNETNIASYTAFNQSGSERMRISSSGNVGIGTAAPTEKLHVNGKVLAVSYEYTSDERLKKNITTIPYALETVNQLNGVTFDWRVDEFPERNMPKERTYGFIAQEVEKHVPELVSTGGDGFKSVQYGNITALLVEAVKELFTDSKEAKEKQKELERQIASLEFQNKKLQIEMEAVKKQHAKDMEEIKNSIKQLQNK